MDISDQQQNRITNPQLWMGLLFFLLVVGTLIYAGVKVTSWLEDEQQVPVQRILVAGDIQFLNKDDVRIAIAESQPGSFFELDINQAHETIVDLPWVYRASLRKEWPNTLKVYVIEQEPIARWNQDLLMNKYGGIFQAPLPLESNALPLLFGPGGSEQTALSGYRAMQGLLKNSGLKIGELQLSERYAWDLRLENGVKLRLGRSEFIDRLQRFVDLYPLLVKNEKQVDYVDLRYDTGLAVGWKDDTKSES